MRGGCGQGRDDHQCLKTSQYEFGHMYTCTHACRNQRMGSAIVLPVPSSLFIEVEPLTDLELSRPGRLATEAWEIHLLKAGLEAHTPLSQFIILVCFLSCFSFTMGPRELTRALMPARQTF